MIISNALLGVALLPSTAFGLGSVYFGSRGSSPLIPPQVPLAEPPALSGTHEFVGALLLSLHTYVEFAVD